MCEPVCHMNFRKWCRKCDLWEGKIRTFVDIWWLSHIPNPRYSFSPMLNTFAHKSGKRTSREMGLFKFRTVNCFSLLCSECLKEKMRNGNTISKLLWELFVRPWDLLVPKFHKKQTNKQCTWDLWRKKHKRCTWDLWAPLSGRVLGLGRPRPVVKAP